MVTLQKTKKYLLLVGVFLFIFIISRMDFRYYYQNLLNVKWLPILLTPIIMALMMTVKTWRWQIILKKQNIIYPYFKALRFYLMGIYFGSLTPGRVGELGKIYYLKNDQKSTADSSIVTILDKVFDIIFVIIFGLIGLYKYYRYFRLNLSTAITMAILLITALFIYYYIRLKSPNFYNRLIRIKNKIINSISHYSLAEILKIFTGTVFSWLLYFLIAYLFNIGLSINNIGFWYTATVTNMAAIVNILPISIMGIGTRDSIFVFFYNLAGTGKELAIAVSMMILAVNLLPAVAGFFFWLDFHKKRTRKLLE